MSSFEVTDETAVTDSHSVTVPSEIRDRLDIEPGDKLRWTLTEDGTLHVEVVRQRYGAFDDLEPIGVGEETDAVEETERVAPEGEESENVAPEGEEMAAALLDSNVIVGARLERDQWHEPATAIVAAMDAGDLPRGCVTNNNLPEVLTPIEKRGGDESARATLAFITETRVSNYSRRRATTSLPGWHSTGARTESRSSTASWSRTCVGSSSSTSTASTTTSTGSTTSRGWRRRTTPSRVGNRCGPGSRRSPPRRQSPASLARTTQEGIVADRTDPGLSAPSWAAGSRESPARL